MEADVLAWIERVTNNKPQYGADYESFIKDAVVLSK
jgi:hypothetical protein